MRYIGKSVLVDNLTRQKIAKIKEITVCFWECEACNTGNKIEMSIEKLKMHSFVQCDSCRRIYDIEEENKVIDKCVLYNRRKIKEGQG